MNEYRRYTAPMSIHIQGEIKRPTIDVREIVVKTTETFLKFVYNFVKLA